MQQIKEDDAYRERPSGKEQRLVTGDCPHLWGKGNGKEGEKQCKTSRKFGFPECILAAVCTALNFLLKFCCCDQVLILWFIEEVFAARLLQYLRGQNSQCFKGIFPWVGMGS